MTRPAGSGREAALLGVLAAAAALTYAAGGPVWDDHTLIVGRLAALDTEGILSLWSTPVGGGEVGAGYYRPLAMTALSALGRLGMTPIHLLAAAAHVTSTWLLYRLLGGGPGGFAGAVIFAVHPVASEVLGWASALPDALAVCFGLAACAAPGWVAAAALTLAACLSKEVAVVIAPALALAGLVDRRVIAGWGLGVLGAVGLRTLAGAGAQVAVGDRWSGAPEVLAAQVSSLTWPWPMTAVPDILVTPTWRVGLGAVTLVALVASLRWGGRRCVGGLAGVLGPLVLALPTVLTGYLASERYLYASLVGVAVWVAGVWSKVGARPRWLWGFAGVVGVLGVVSHAVRAPDWRGDRPLFQAAVAVSPDSSYAWHFLGHAYRMDGDHQAAGAAFRTAVETGHPHPADRQLCLESLVLAGAYLQAMEWAEAGPQEGLTADAIAWRARAAMGAGRVERARQLVGMLRIDGGWDGPPWVAELAQSLSL